MMEMWVRNVLTKDKLGGKVLAVYNYLCSSDL
jgi:hypothetical protein